MYDVHDLEVLLQSGPALVVCASPDERRVVSLFSRVAERVQREPWSWTCVEGLRRLGQDSEAQSSLADPERLLQHIRKLTRPGLFLLLDFHPYLSEAKVIRLIKEVVLDAEVRGHTLVLLSSELQLPNELAPYSVHYHLQLPDSTEIARIVRDELQKFLQREPERKVVADEGSVALLINSLRGLPEADIRRLARGAICDDAAVTRSDIDSVMQAKRSLLQKDGVLEFEFDTATLNDIAGFSNLKRWLAQRKAVMTQPQRGSDPLSLPPPKGVLLLGVQGCGKSLAAKAIAGGWSLPLLRLDMGAVFNKYMGETERRIRDALKNSEALAPCVLWIDELEKGIASTDFDGGTSQRVLGTLLTWMAERKNPVFLVATANNVQALPAELLRKGRFDEIFFVDLPNSKIREELFRIHLEKRGYQSAGYQLQSLAAATEGFSGAEIEQLIVSALYSAKDSGRPLTQEILQAEIGLTKTLSTIMAEQVSQLRAWAADRCVPAD